MCADESLRGVRGNFDFDDPQTAFVKIADGDQLRIGTLLFESQTYSSVSNFFSKFSRYFVVIHICRNIIPISYTIVELLNDVTGKHVRPC